MVSKVFQSFFFHVICLLHIDDVLYVHGQISQEILEQGRTQYQILQERGNLPRYGPCWKAAIEHVEDGCKALTEETQSDMALHLTNCFLEMSGHETYNCELNKKPNLKAICINSMSDRAFNVYTEFYTHSQNICWFLREQVWHETIAENTLKVGKQLESSAKNQEKLLKGQQESLELQEKLLVYGKSLEKVMEDFYVSTKEHQEVLTIMTNSLNNLQSWLLGEVSWLDTFVFYVFAIILFIVLTAAPRTLPARLPVFCLLVLNIGIERFMFLKFSTLISDIEIHFLQRDLNWYIWVCRYFFTIMAALIIFYKAITFKDLQYENNVLLRTLHEQNLNLIQKLKGFQERNSFKESTSFISETQVSNSNEKLHYSFVSNKPNERLNSVPKEIIKPSTVCTSSSTMKDNFCYAKDIIHSNQHGSSKRDGLLSKRNNSQLHSSYSQINRRYNLRARTETPEKLLA